MTKTQPRTMQVISRNAAGVPSLLAITTGKPGTKAHCRTVYALTYEPVRDGVHYHMDKVEGGSDGEETAYDVLLSESMGNECGCKGFVRHGRCKHVDAVALLSQIEKQRPAPAPVCDWCRGTGRLTKRTNHPCGCGTPLVKVA